MQQSRYDALVVGAGPAGSVAALVLARGGASVALVDKMAFPRDKACGDLVGPRGVRVLEALGLFPDGRRVGDMQVVGPTGRKVLLPAVEGVTYPGFGVALPRRTLDADLRDAALSAGAEGFTGRADTPLMGDDGQLEGFESGDVAVRADVVIGADGALSRVGAVAGLVDEGEVLWGFAIRGYLDGAPPLPQIVFWERHRGVGYPGYGWVFPGAGDEANIGVGVGVRGDRRGGARAAQDLDAFVASMRPGSKQVARRLGGWLKMGMVGTVPARGRTLLVGDAAGLVNSLQGEGIAQAMESGVAAAEAVLARGPANAARHYRTALADRLAPYASATAPITAWMLGHPRAVAAISRAVTAPVVGASLAGGWAVWWNALLDGAAPGRGRQVAAVADVVARAATRWTRDARAVATLGSPS